MKTNAVKKPRRYKLVTEEKAAGVTYTPAPLADFVSEQIAGAMKIRARSIRILDPAVGDGALLTSLLTALQARKSNLSISVVGFDTNADAIALTRRRITSAFPKTDLCLMREDFLQHTLKYAQTDQQALFAEDSTEPYDLIIANPPYVRTQIIGSDQAQTLGSAFGLSGRVDLYHAFLVAIAKLLRPGGIAGIIVSNRFMTTKGGAALRATLRESLTLHHIWDLGDTRLFEAAVLPAVILAEGGCQPLGRATKFTSIYETKLAAHQTAENALEALALTGSVALRDGRHFAVKHGELDTGATAASVWRIRTDELDSWLATVASNSWGSFRNLGKIRVGVKTCADKVFIRSDWTKLQPSLRPELLRPLTTHHSAGRYRAMTPKTTREILYPHEVVNGSRRATNLSDFPRAARYLEQHRSALEARTYVLEGGRKWYEIWVPQDPSSWAAPKLVFRDISERPTFWLDLDGTIVNGDCYWLTADRPEHVEHLWLAAAVANSTFSEAFYDHRFNNKLYAGRRRYITQYVEQFPIPDPSSKISKKIIAMARTIYEENHSTTVAQLEETVDELVWNAFGLPFKERGR